MNSDLWTSATILIGGIATLGIFSFLIKENPFYRFFEHLFIGIAAGFLPILTIRDFLWPKILLPMLGYNISTYPDGTPTGEYNSSYLLFLFPMAVGLLYYFIYSKKYGWLAKIAIGIALGVSAGLSFKGFFAEMMPQFASSFKPLIVLEGGSFDVWSSVNNIIFVFTLLAVMYYFFFTFRRRTAAGHAFAGSGRWLMMVCFGAFFGSTVMARLALLVERIEFVLITCTDQIVSLFFS